jgi:hypothetical protein
LSKVPVKEMIDLRTDKTPENFYMVVFLTRDARGTSPGHSYVATLRFRDDAGIFVEYGDPHLFGLYPKSAKVWWFGDVPGEMRIDPPDAKPEQVLFAWVNKDQVEKAFRTRDQWQARGKWNANDGDCVSFMAAVAKAIGMVAPERDSIWPIDYMEKLKKANR